MSDAKNPFGHHAVDLNDEIYFWQGECFNVSFDPAQPWWVVTLSAPFGVMVHRVLDRQPDATSLWEVVQEALRIPQVGDFRRPRVLKAKPDKGWEQLEEQLQELGIALEICEELDPVDGVMETIDSAYVEWNKRQSKWKILSRDANGNVITLEAGLIRADAEAFVATERGEWIEKEISDE